MTMSKKQFVKQCKPLLKLLSDAEFKFNSMLQSETDYKKVVIAKEALDNAFDRLINCYTQREESLVESARNSKDKNSLKAKVSNLQTRIDEYGEKYQSFLTERGKDINPGVAPSYQLPPHVPEVPAVIPVQSNAQSSISTTSSSAVLRKTLAKNKLDAKIAYEQKCLELEYQRQCQEAEIQYKYERSVAK